MTAYFLAFLFSGFMGAHFARRRGRNPWLWFIVGFLCGLLGIVFLLFADGRAKRKRAVIKPSRPSIALLPVQEGIQFWYYLDEEKQQHGPSSTQALNEMLCRGKIGGSTYVWSEGMKEWKLLRDLLPEQKTSTSSL